MATQAQVQELRQLGRDQYEVDGGVLEECYDDQALADMIDADGSVQEAWAFHLGVVDAKRESQACYDLEPTGMDCDYDPNFVEFPRGEFPS